MLDYRAIIQIKKDPPTFMQDHLTWRLLPIEDRGIPFYVERNDGVAPTEQDFSQVQESILFLIAPQYGPVQ